VDGVEERLAHFAIRDGSGENIIIGESHRLFEVRSKKGEADGDEVGRALGTVPLLPNMVIQAKGPKLEVCFLMFHDQETTQLSRQFIRLIDHIAFLGIQDRWWEAGIGLVGSWNIQSQVTFLMEKMRCWRLYVGGKRMIVD
jgi:hypothetical protein